MQQWMRRGGVCCSAEGRPGLGETSIHTAHMAAICNEFHALRQSKELVCERLLDHIAIYATDPQAP